MIKKLYFLGPIGSYTQLAAEKISSYINIEELVPVDSIYKISRILKENNFNEYGAIIPIENSIEGILRESQDNLADLAKIGYRIQAETCLDIEHSLVSFGKKDEIKNSMCQVLVGTFPFFLFDVNSFAVLSSVQKLITEHLVLKGRSVHPVHILQSILFFLLFHE